MIFLSVIIGLYLGIIILLNIPYIQQKIANIVTIELEQKLHTNLSIGKIDIGLMNRIIVDDILVKDQSGKEMLKVARLSAKFEILPLFKQKITIRSVQLFGFNIHLNKKTPKDPLNCKFVIDAFASKDTLKKKTNLDLRINSILIRRGDFQYDVLSEPESPTKFNAKHIKCANIFANISLKALQKDSLNASIKRLSFEEKSGFEIKKLALKVTGNAKGGKIEHFIVGLPQTEIKLSTIFISFDSLNAFKHLTDEVIFSTRILPSYITLQNISPFVPALANFRDQLNLEMRINGTINQLTASELKIHYKNDLTIDGGVTFQELSNAKNTYIFGKIKSLNINRSGTDFLVRNLAKNYSGTPPILKRIGKVSFKGEISGYFNDLVTYGTFNTSLGTVKTDVKFSAIKGLYTYSGAIKTGAFNLGQLLNNDKFGNAALNVSINGSHHKGGKPNLAMKGLVTSFDYSGYNYKSITLDANYQNGGFEGQATLNDDNGNVYIGGKMNLSQSIPTFNLRAAVDKLKPHNLHLTNKYKDADFSLSLNANFSGRSIDDMIGVINVDSFSYASPDKNYSFNSLNITAKQSANKEKTLELNSEFLKATFSGKYSYRTIPTSILKTVERYIPSLLSINKKWAEPHNDFKFNIDIYNTDILSNVFNIPLSINKHASIKGFFNDNERKLKIEGYFPNVQYNKLQFESGLVLCESATNQFKCQVRANNKLNKGGVVSLSLEALAQNDKVHTSINWGNNALSTYSGQLSTITNFFKTAGKNPILQAKIDIEPTKVILNDSIWNIYPSKIEVDSGRVYVKDFLFKHKDQFIKINGKATKNINDTIKVDLNDINIGYVFDIVNLKSVDFTGNASGSLYVNQVMKSPIMNTRLAVTDFAFNQGKLGNMNIYGEWDKEKEGIFLNAKIKEPNISESNVTGYIYPGKKSLDLNIHANNTNVSFLHTYLQSIATNIKGRASGNIRLFGEFNALNLQGSAMANASFKINILNTNFAIQDSVKFTPNEMSFKDIKVKDPEGHIGIVNGYVRHEHFKNMNYRFQMNVNNMLVYNGKESADLPFYGSVYGTGNALLTGTNSGINVDVAMSTNKNSNFVYKMSSANSASNNQFVSFIDRTPKRVLDFTETTDHKISEKENESAMDVHLNMLIDATPDATMKIIVDPVSNDYIVGKGTGNIRMEYYNKGDVKMFGNYTIDHGTYKFSLQEIIRKDFNIKSGSTVSFNGNPLNANLDIKASYTVNSVSLGDLGSEVPDDIKQSNVKVNCLMNISGILLHPAIKLGIELPNESEDKQRIVQNVISTDDQINMQTLYLLGIGKFYTLDYNANQNSNAVSSVLSSTLSGQLNNMLSQVLNSNNWNIGINGSTGTKGWTDMEFEGMLSGQLLNNRLLINGNFGYKKNPAINTSFVGNFDMQYLLTKEVIIKAYNQSNDKYYTRTTLNTQGLGIMYKKDFNGWKELLPWYKKKVDTTSQPKDSVPNNSKETVIPATSNNPHSKKKRER